MSVCMHFWADPDETLQGNLSDGHRGSDVGPYPRGPRRWGSQCKKCLPICRWMYAAIVNTVLVIRVCLYHMEVFVDRKRLHIA